VKWGPPESVREEY